MRKFVSRAKRGLLVLSPIAVAVAMVAAAAPSSSDTAWHPRSAPRCNATSA